MDIRYSIDVVVHVDDDTGATSIEVDQGSVHEWAPPDVPEEPAPGPQPSRLEVARGAVADFVGEVALSVAAPELEAPAEAAPAEPEELPGEGT